MPDGPPLVLLATSLALRDLTPDDRLFAVALARRGVMARAAVWDDPEVDWNAHSVVLRSTWDYFHRPTEFLSWAARVAAGALLQNPLPVITWNAHKHYLSALQQRGVPIIDTVFFSRGDSCNLAALAQARSWNDIVIKPAISAAGHETRCFGADERAAAQSHVNRLLAAGDVMVQPYLAPLAALGELSVIFIGGQFSHGIRRRSAFSNDRGMPKDARETPSAAAVRCAERVLAAAIIEMGASVTTPPLLYARVDLAEPSPGEWLLLELELIEPSLFFRQVPEAAEQMAELLVRRL
jgi:hypothetical protein